MKKIKINVADEKRGNKKTTALIAMGIWLVMTIPMGLFLLINQLGIGSIPPLMQQLDPFHGIWKREGFALKNKEISYSHQDLKESARVFYDSEGIPHIFAQNDEDLFWLEGFIVARDRLWQMDIQSRIADGKLSELLGEKGLFLDKYFVQMGMRSSITEVERKMWQDPVTQKAGLRFTEGVNAFIKTLKVNEMPIEYFLTQTKPRLWTLRNIASLLKLMAFRLAAYSDDLKLTHYMQKFGVKVIDDLFPQFLPTQSPFALLDSTQKIKPVDKNKSDKISKETFVSALKNFPEVIQPTKGNGSNNWAVSGKKTRSGYTLLANDTHLSYSFPSIWYEWQLQSPQTSVYGSTIPGTLGAIIGYNHNIAWATTNGTTDVLDWYEVEFKNETSTEYLLDGEWHFAQMLNEDIKVKDQKNLSLSILKTYWGPIIYREGKLGLAMRWIAFEPTNELKALLNVNKARNYQECLISLEDFKVPLQNFICADSQNISLRHNGYIPRRREGDGRYIMDGRSKKNDWQGWLSQKETPVIINPPSGWVASANQRPLALSGSQPYLGWYYPEAFRGLRIKEFLDEHSQMDEKDMMNLQNDELNRQAKEALPVLLQYFKSNDLKGIVGSEMAQQIKEWDYFDHADSLISSLYSYWWKNLERKMWENQFGSSPQSLYPTPDRTLMLLKNPDSSKASEYGLIIVEALKLAWKELSELKGPDVKKWIWYQVRPTVIDHVSLFPGLGTALGSLEPIRMGGSKYAVNANKGRHGPTWRMVVAFKPQPEGWGNYPGGTPGDPFNKNYTRFVSAWSQGQYRKHKYFSHMAEAEKEAIQILNFIPLSLHHREYKKETF